MRKFRRFYFFVPIVTVMLTITVKLVVGSVNDYKKNIIIDNHQDADTVVKPKPSIEKTGNARPVVAAADTLVKPLTDSLSADTLTSLSDTLAVKDSTPVRIDTFTLRISKDTLEAPVEYTAKDSAIVLLKSKTITLHGAATTGYQDMKLDAPTIQIDQNKSVLSAYASRDSVGGIKDYAKMTQADQPYQLEEMSYNYKTMKGITKGTITQQGEMFVHADIVKSVNKNVMYGYGNFFTTCNLDHPHFGFRAQRAKIVNKKLAVTGAVRPEFDSVPVPIYLPFGFYPLTQGRHSGILAPSIETNDWLGLGLRGLGYYLAFNDYWDARVEADIYSYGSWDLRLTPSYRKIYKYQGGMALSYSRRQQNFKRDPDYSLQHSYSVNWQHSSDMRSKPGQSFSASVNFSSTNHARNILNNNYAAAQATAASSITYTKTWQDKPFNFSASMNHNQNNQTRSMNFQFPNLAFSMSTIYPLQKKNSAGDKKWYEQLGIGYQGSFNNQVNFYDSLKYGYTGDPAALNGKGFRTQNFGKFLLDTLQWNARHSIPITLSLPPILGGAVVVSPSVSYSMEWLDRSINRSWGAYSREVINEDGSRRTVTFDTILNKLDKGFFMRQQMSFGLSFNTALYGTYQFKNSKVVAMRHVVRPTFGLSYTPDLNSKLWERVQIDSAGSMGWFNKLDGNLYNKTGAAMVTSFKTGGINFGLDNTLELKKRVRKKADTDSTATDTGNPETDFTKIKLIEGFGFNGSYNLLADSMKLSDINIYFRTNLFEKISITSSANLSPYKYNKFGTKTSKYAWQDGFSVGSIRNANLSMSTSFQSKPKDAKKEKARKDAINQALNDPLARRDQQLLLEDMQRNPADYVDFNTPWSVNLSFNLNYTKMYDNVKKAMSNNITSSANVGGSFNLTPKWNFSAQTSYDFNTMKVQMLTFAISRDLHCWQMAINVAPIGWSRYFNFTVSPKSGLLQDLKINRNRSFYTGR